MADHHQHQHRQQQQQQQQHLASSSYSIEGLIESGSNNQRLDFSTFEQQVTNEELLSNSHLVINQ
jgi:hypothetical protein